MKQNKHLTVQVEQPVSALEKIEIEKSIKQKYGDDTGVTIKNKRVKNKVFEEQKDKLQTNNLTDVYKKYLADNYPEVNEELFFELDQEISRYLPDDSSNKRFKLKWIKSKNVMSFNEMELELDSQGIMRIYSEPRNMGGKSNLIRIIKILLFGEFYRSNQERSTLPSIMHKFSPLNHAHVEGEVEIEGKNYVIRREFTRNASDKVSQKVIISSDGLLVDTAHFNALIGSIKQFLFTSFFDTFSIEKWINTKPTERYRLFLQYFGLSSIEDKHKIAKKQYETFLNTSSVRKYQNINPTEAMLVLQKEISDNDSLILLIDEEQEKLSAKLLELKSEINKLENQKKGVPEILYGETPSTIQQKINNINAKISDVEAQIKAAQSDILTVENDKSFYEAQLSQIQDSIAAVKEPAELTNTIETYNYLYNNYKPDQTTLAEKETIQRQIESLRVDYNTEKNLKAAKEAELSKTPPTTKCSLCNGESDNSVVINNLHVDIATCDATLSSIVEKGKEAKVKMEAFEVNLKDDEIKYKKQISHEINEVKKQITSFIEAEISEKKKQLYAVQQIIDKINRNEVLENKILNLKSVNVANQQNLQLYENNLKQINSFGNEVEFNNKIEENIKVLQSSINQYEEKLINTKVNLKEVNSINHQKTLQLDDLISNQDKIKRELALDKTYKAYLEIHSKGGLAMTILAELSNDINQELAVLLEEDFIPYIAIEDDSIEFYYFRDGVQFNMSEGSGYEKTVLSLALHYLLLLKMDIPISNIFILDEVFVSVAEPFLHRAYKVIEQMLNVFDTILLITHIDAVSAWSDKSIQITKTNNISKIQL